MAPTTGRGAAIFVDDVRIGHVLTLDLWNELDLMRLPALAQKLVGSAGLLRVRCHLDFEDPGQAILREIGRSVAFTIDFTGTGQDRIETGRGTVSEPGRSAINITHHMVRTYYVRLDPVETETA